MKKMSILLFALLLIPGVFANAEKAKDFEQAKTLSANSGLPILLEFVHED